MSKGAHKTITIVSWSIVGLVGLFFGLVALGVFDSPAEENNPTDEGAGAETSPIAPQVLERMEGFQTQAGEARSLVREALSLTGTEEFAEPALAALEAGYQARLQWLQLCIENYRLTELDLRSYNNQYSNLAASLADSLREIQERMRQMPAEVQQRVGNIPAVRQVERALQELNEMTGAMPAWESAYARHESAYQEAEDHAQAGRSDQAQASAIEAIKLGFLAMAQIEVAMRRNSDERQAGVLRGRLNQIDLNMETMETAIEGVPPRSAGTYARERRTWENER